MTVVLYLLIFIAGAAVGILTYLTLYAKEPPSRYVHYRGGYYDGHHDGTLGIWRGGPLR